MIFVSLFECLSPATQKIGMISTSIKRKIISRQFVGISIIFSGSKLVIVDWESATFEDDDSLEDQQNWKVSDRNGLEAILEGSGFECKRPEIPDWAFGWQEALNELKTE